MHQLKYEFGEEEREELFLTWNIHRESKERKGQLLRKVCVYFWAGEVGVGG